MIFPEGIKVYGDINYRNKNCPVEDAELITYFSQLLKLHPELSAIALHIKNEGKRTGQQVNSEKAKGALKTGACDIIIPLGFACELKRIDHTKSRIEEEQVNYLNAHQALGGFSCIALGYVAALEATEFWLQQYHR